MASRSQNSRSGCLLIDGESQRGFTYFGILITIALIGTALSAVGATWSTSERRAREVELIYVGQAFRRAIASYYRSSPTGVHQYPQRLENLLEDNRGTRVQRHLRQIYRDPITGEHDWNVITLPEGGIIGVASLSDKQPLKKRNFEIWEASFEDAGCFCDWQFVYLPQLVGNAADTP